MLRSFFIITLRILWRNKVTSFINIFSLTIGITAFILIMLYVNHEMSYDKFNENYERIYRLQGRNYGKLPPVIGDYVKERIPEVENIARLADGFGPFITYKPEGNPEAIKQIQISSSWADSTTFNVFSFSFLRGDPSTALIHPYTVVLAESTAKNLFGDKNPIGEIVETNHQYEVTGVIRDIENFHMDIDALFSSGTIEKIYPERDLNNAAANSWLWSGTYLLLEENSDPKLVEDKINQVLAEINDGNLISIVFDSFQLLPLREIYFKGSIAKLQYGKQGNIKLVQTFIVIAIFILALACINYINLTTARGILRAKEVAMKKVVGSTRTLLRYQFIFESILVSMLSFLIAFTLIQGLLPQFNLLAMVEINLSQFNTPIVWLITLLCVITMGTISGFYPAMYLTSVRPVSLILGETFRGSRGTIFRRVLLTFQFTISILLIIGLITNLRQLHYARKIDLGFDKEYIITIPTSDSEEAIPLRETIRKKLLQNPNILKIAYNAGKMGSQLPIMNAVEIEGKENTFNWIPIEPDYLDLMGMKIIEGRNFSWDIEADCTWDQKENKIKDERQIRLIINEAAAEQIFGDSAVGRIYHANTLNFRDFTFEVIGIVKNFHYRSLHYKVEPVCMLWNWPQYLLHVKISPHAVPTTIDFIKDKWEEVYGSAPFSYTFLDEEFDQQYKSDEQGTKIIGFFTVLAILIACMGLFALSSFMAVRRTKEIGIRKAMGASTQNIFLLLSQEFVKWVMLSVIIASPIAWYVMNRWLQGFAYRINLGVDIFILAAVIALVIAFITVTWQSLKTALANPIEALRYE